MTDTERSWATHDKTEWGPGPWQNEPDKVQWVDPVTGLDCLIVRNGGGALCGYVGVPPDHPWHGVGYSTCLHGCTDEDGNPKKWCDYEHSPQGRIDVHGGLTYTDVCQPSDDPSSGICHVPEPGRPDSVWWFGFDCAHSRDVTPAADARDVELGIGLLRLPGSVYRDVGYVRGEVASLARQLAVVDA